MLYPVKIEFREYPSGSWQDWSEYLIEPPRISKKVESENEGEAGVIVFDDASVSFRYDSGSPVYNAFSIDLTSKQRYLFRITTFKTDKTFVRLFEGVADFSTLKWNEFNNVISFSLIDKLSALNLLKKTTLRGASKNILYDRNTDPEVNKISIATGAGDTVNHHKWFNMFYQRDTLIKPTIDSNTPQLGEIIQSPYDTTTGLSIVKYKAKKVGDNLSTDPMYLDVLTTDATYPKTSGNQKSVTNLFYYINEIYGVDLLVKQYRTDYKLYYKDAGNTIEIALQPGYEVIGYDALKLIDALVKSVWPDITIIKRPVNLEFILPLDNFIRLVTEDLFGKEPLDALKMISDSMKCYIFIDRNGNLVIQSKSSLDTFGQTRSIGNTKIISGPDQKYSWDKLADGAIIKALSWARDGVTGEFLTGIAEVTKQEVGFTLSGKIKPKNAIKKDIIVGDASVNTQAELDSYAATEALNLLEFYGKRHSSFDLTLNLDDNTIDWELIDRLILNSLTTFFTKLDFDLNERTIKIEAVEITGHDYDFRQLIFSSAESSSSSYSFSSGASGGTSSSGFIPNFNLPLQMSGGIVSLLTTDNLKLTSNSLDTTQPIKTTDTPTFNQVNLSAMGSITQAVRGDRSILTSAPLSGGGDLTANRTLALSYNATNLKLTSNALDTIQNIATSSSPTFNNLNLSGLLQLTTGTSNANSVAWGTEIYLFRSGANELRLTGAGLRIFRADGGTPILTIGDNTSANVTASITSAASQYTDILFRTSNSTRWAFRKNSDAESGSNAGSNFVINRYNDSGALIDAALFIRRSTGNIGIGNLTSPNEKLEVNGNIHVSGGDRTIFNRSSNYLAFGTNNTERMRILNNGNVAIGTTVASERLTVSGNIYLAGHIYSYGEILNIFNGNIEQMGSKSLYNDFTSGWTGSGWRIGYDAIDERDFFSNLELDNLWVRGSMTVYELIINQIRATNGSLFVSSTARVAYSSTDTSYNIRITFEDPEGHNICPFMVDDIILMQRVRLDSTTIVKRVAIRVMTVTGNTIEGNYLTGSPVDGILKGELFVRVGNYTNSARRGSLYLTSDDSNAPYMDVIDGVSQWSEWGSSDKLKVRLGRLTGITDSFFGSLSGYGLYAKSNAYLRGRIYAEAGGWIAGWNINNSELASPQVTVSSMNNIFRLNANNSTGLIGSHLYLDTSGINQSGYLSFGRVLSGTGSIENKFGIAYKQGTSTFFELTNTDRNIAGWNFDTTKFWNGTVSLESGASIKGLVVDTDKIKIGEFTHTTMSNSLTNITTTILNGYSGIHISDSAWGIVGNWWDTDNKIQDVGLELHNNLIKCVIGTAASTWDYRLTHKMFSHETKVLGKTFRVDFKLYFTAYPDYMEDGGYYEVAIRYYNSSWGTTYRQVILSGTVSNGLNTQTIDKTGSNGIMVTLSASIPNFEHAYIEWVFYGGAQSGTHYPKTMELTDVSFHGYENYKTWLNGTGLYMYNNDNNYIKLFADSAEINIPLIKIRGKQLVRFHGIQSSNPQNDVELGDIYIRSSDKKVLCCTEINNLGIPQWSLLN